MSRPFFFGGSQATPAASPYLVQFKAGKLTKNGNLVSPVKDKKGIVYLHQSHEDSLMHFCWKDRTTGQVEDDLIIFPDDAEFLKVPQCTTGRVFVLKFKTSPRRLFFWSQEPKEDKDEEYVNKINEYINNPPTSRSGGSGHSMLSPSDLSMNPEDELRNLFSNSDVSAQQLMSMLGNVRGLAGMGGAGSLASLLSGVSGGSNRSSSSNVSTPAAPQTPTTTPAVASSNATSESSSTTGGTNSPAGLRLQDLQNIISGLSTGQSADSDVSVDLSSSVNAEVLRPLLTNDAFMQRVREKLPATTATPPTTTPQIAEQLTATVQSPQFQQAMSSFSAALQSGQLGPLVQQFGLPEDCVTAANSGNLEAFVRGLQKQQTSDAAKGKDNSTVSQPAKKEDKPDDDQMALD